MEPPYTPSDADPDNNPLTEHGTTNAAKSAASPNARATGDAEAAPRRRGGRSPRCRPDDHPASKPRKPRGRKQILSSSRLTFRSQPIGLDGNTLLPTESLGERHLIHVLKECTDVRDLKTQEPAFSVTYLGRDHDYTPDIYAEVWLGNDPAHPLKVIFEEKSDYWFAKTPDGDARLAACRAVVEAQGYRFHLIFRSKIERARNNIQTFIVTRLNVAPPAAADVAILKRCLPATFGELVAKFGDSLVRASLAHKHIYLANLDVQLSDKSLVVLEPYRYANLFP